MRADSNCFYKRFAKQVVALIVALARIIDNCNVSIPAKCLDFITDPGFKVMIDVSPAVWARSH